MCRLRITKCKCDNDPTHGNAADDARELTFYADDFRPVPLAVGATLGGGHVALQEAVGALVASHGVDVVVGALTTNQEGVVHGGRGSTKHCGGRRTHL